MPSIQQSSALLALPAELQNQIYDYVAHSTDKTVMITAPDKTVSLPAPFGQVCNQLREEFTSVFYSLSLAYATNIVLYNTKFDLLSLILGLRDILDRT
ncbi:hypothetical protein B0A55_08182 [Friedmanniomyces simplex]|uniref:Uncharacterized protein n=1 Tax=Friedmanniomyces simplex TaxID=329884 RepID=A0A4U0WUE7_9PEZI|nr:hypothetical protein B0A55_08182 [Friedmanniomyces simplex]